MTSGSLSYPRPLTGGLRVRAAAARLFTAPELLGLLALAGVLNLWGLSINGWANEYYSAAVRSMTRSWHNFLFASFDPSGLMTVDKPPLALWIQALSARVFGFHPLSLLVPQALMGVVATGLLYHLVRRQFGRIAGFVAGLALATTPIIVAVSRHNNPDELLVLCSVAALWFATRALETRRTRWLILCGVAVGLGFETKMLEGLMVVPALVLAWLWTSSPGLRSRLAALRQLLAGGLAMVLVGGAWPLLVTLTPAADRPWISGTGDNSIGTLIFGYNGLGRIAGQGGGPPGGGSGGGAGPGVGGGSLLFGGSTGPFRLLNAGLGDQAGWLLGFAIVAGLGLLVATRLRRRDPRTGWLIVVGGAFLTTAIAFSFAKGIFHPYYVSLLAPFTAALIGAGVAQMLPGDRRARVFAPLAIGAGAITELVVLGEVNGSLSWARPVLIVVAGGAAILLALRLAPRERLTVLTVALVVLFAAPAVWAAETLGHATNGTFPMGGAQSALGGGPGGPGSGFGGSPGRLGGSPGGTRSFAPPPGPLGSSAAPGGGFAPPGGGFARPGAGGARGGFGGGAGGLAGNTSSLKAAVRYARAHGGGSIGVASQSDAAPPILSQDADVAGLGGFSGRESTVSVAWLTSQIRDGHLRWILAQQGQGSSLPGDTRQGSQSAISVAERVCPAVTVRSPGGTQVKMYDCQGQASKILQASSDGTRSGS